MLKPQFLNESYLNTNFTNSNVSKLFDENPRGIGIGSIYLKYKNFQFYNCRKASLSYSRNNNYHYQLSFSKKLLELNAFSGNDDPYKWTKSCGFKYGQNIFEAFLGYSYHTENLDFSSKLQYSILSLQPSRMSLNLFTQNDKIKTNTHFEYTQKIDNFDYVAQLYENFQLRFQKTEQSSISFSYVQLFNYFTAGIRYRHYFAQNLNQFSFAAAKAYQGWVIKLVGVYDWHRFYGINKLQVQGIISESPKISVNGYIRHAANYQIGFEISIEDDLSKKF